MTVDEPVVDCFAIVCLVIGFNILNLNLISNRQFGIKEFPSRIKCPFHLSVYHAVIVNSVYNT